MSAGDFYSWRVHHPTGCALCSHEPGKEASPAFGEAAGLQRNAKEHQPPFGAAIAAIPSILHKSIHPNPLLFFLLPLDKPPFAVVK